ncbi:phage tail tape measure protein [Actinobacillus genomosp. 2]|uniref:phage tail tape measure protein n=1 Tax=Actinobacillus genomosp. 2 TaxID=230709 RepID=UPI0024410FF5|nr:phage tail tape measure protein [Actinobacillus genomosp. 2]WGE32596.1 phage tail tape measure protein [Actinobacillus genomosp. 2]
MAKNMKVQLELTAKDTASPVLNQAAKTAEKAFKDTERAAQRSGNAQSQAAQQAANATQAANKKIEQSYRNARKVAADVASARETLGIRSENAIQREIEQTRAAYDRLKRSGIASQNELRRASEATKQRVKELNAELGKTSFGDKAAGLGRGAMNVGVGLAAGVAMTRQPARNQMEFDRQLAMASNTAFSDRDVKGRIEGKRELLAAVQEAVKVGGGTKEDALVTLDTLIASGTMKAETAMNLLPTLQKGAVATGSNSEDMAKIAISAMQQFGIKEQDVGRVLDMAVAAGQAGNFELKDMASWLPQQMAAAKSIGLQGIDGFETLLVANQQARVTAGTSDEAGNNLVNLLAKITSTETKKRLEDLEYVDSKGKVKSINYMKSMEHYKGKGQDSLQAFMSVMEDTVVNNDQYKNLQQRLKTAKDEEAQQLLKQMTDLIEASAIGEVISDRQALMALVAIRNNKELGNSVRADVQSSEGAVEKSHAVIRDTNSHKVEALKNATEFAQMENFEKVNGVLGTLAEYLTNYANQYPNLTQFVSGATDAVKIFGAALAASSVLDLLTGGKAKSGVLSKVADVATGGISGSAVKGTGGAGFWSKLGIVGFGLSPTEANKGEQEAIDKRFADMKAKGNYPSPKNIQPNAQSSILWSLPNVIGTLKPKVEATSQVLSNYQADFQAFGDTISAGLQAGLASQSHTIANQITVELDGSVVAEKVSEYQFNFNKRMA